MKIRFDKFPRTSELICRNPDIHPEQSSHVETVVCLSQQKPDDVIRVGLDELEVTPAEAKATYGEIKAYVKEHTGLAVSSLYIAQVKQKYGIIERENYNKPKSEGVRDPVDLCSAPTKAAAKTARNDDCLCQRIG